MSPEPPVLDGTSWSLVTAFGGVASVDAQFPEPTAPSPQKGLFLPALASAGPQGHFCASATHVNVPALQAVFQKASGQPGIWLRNKRVNFSLDFVPCSEL